MSSKRQAQEVEAALSGIRSIPTVRQILRKLTWRCDDNCRGWIIADSDQRGLEVQRCDDCCATRSKEEALCDEEVAQLPEAQRALKRIIRAEEQRIRLEQRLTGRK